MIYVLEDMTEKILGAIDTFVADYKMPDLQLWFIITQTANATPTCAPYRKASLAPQCRVEFFNLQEYDLQDPEAACLHGHTRFGDD